MIYICAYVTEFTNLLCIIVNSLETRNMILGVLCNKLLPPQITPCLEKGSNGCVFNLRSNFIAFTNKKVA